jgi:hypothetical protein
MGFDPFRTTKGWRLRAVYAEGLHYETLAICR